MQQKQNKLSVVMSFLNEREEVGNTIRSIRQTAGYDVDIVVVNDASDDGYNYEADISGFAIYLISRLIRKGSVRPFLPVIEALAH